VSFKWLSTYGQIDTTIVKDFTKALVRVAEDKTRPITEVSGIRSGGFFIPRGYEGTLKICNRYPMTLWMDGRLVKQIKGCENVDFSDFDLLKSRDTIFINLFSEEGFSELRLEQIKISSQEVKKSDNKLARLPDNQFKEFIIIGGVFFLIIAGAFIVRFPNRVNYLTNRVFSLNSNTYSLANTRLFSSVGLSLCSLLSLVFGFSWVFIIQGELEKELPGLVMKWLELSSYIFLFILFKWFFSLVISKLFYFKNLYEFQLFDFMNFLTISGSIVLGIMALNFIFGWPVLTLGIKGLVVLYLLTLVFSIIFIGLKFVTNSPRKKLTIISYLCATELIPSILTVGWFFK